MEKIQPAEAQGTAKKVFFITGAVLFALGLFLTMPQNVKLIVFLMSYLFTGGDVLLDALRNILKGQVFDEKFLMCLATIGAFCTGQYAEGVAVMLFYRVGEYFEDLAVNHSQKSIASLMDIRPDSANLKKDGKVEKVSPQNVSVGDMILVRPGERIPLDGIVVEGKSFIDTSALTGESVPRSVVPGKEVLSGSVNKGGVVTVKVTKEYVESTATKILDLVQNAASQKAPTEKFITKFAKVYTPVVVFSALALALLPPLLIPGAVFSDWINRALTFLVVSCPCALVISVPMSFFGGIGAASQKGILVKGSNYLEALNRVNTAVFDKTGTLTRGTFRVTKEAPAEGVSNDSLLDLAAHAELYSSHPIALSIREAYGKEPDASRVSDYEEITGKGVCAKIDGRPVLAGKATLLDGEQIPHPEPEKEGTIVFLAADGRFFGYLIISDELKPDSAGTISGLESSNIHTVMLTGDSRAAGERTADRLGIKVFYTDLLPQQKVEITQELKQELPAGGKLLFVGDGINDAPVLTSADIGVAMGGLGSDAAIEAADVVLMTDEPSKLITAIQIARKTHAIVQQNIIFALFVKLLILVLAAFGIATMWAAVFGDVGVTVIAVLNSIRTTSIGRYGNGQKV